MFFRVLRGCPPRVGGPPARPTAPAGRRGDNAAFVFFVSCVDYARVIVSSPKGAKGARRWEGGLTDAEFLGARGICPHPLPLSRAAGEGSVVASCCLE